MRDQVALEVERAYRNAIRADQLVVVARQALVAREDAERLTVGQMTAGVALSAAAQEAAAHRTAAESALLEAELGAHVAHAELARAVGERSALGLLRVGLARSRERRENALSSRA